MHTPERVNLGSSAAVAQVQQMGSPRNSPKPLLPATCCQVHAAAGFISDLDHCLCPTTHARWQEHKDQSTKQRTRGTHSPISNSQRVPATTCFSNMLPQTMLPRIDAFHLASPLLLDHLQPLDVLANLLRVRLVIIPLPARVTKRVTIMVEG